MLRTLYHRLPLSPRWKAGLRRAWQQWSRGSPVALVEPATAAKPVVWPEPTAGARDWVFFGVIDWHFRHQRPQQLALALARLSTGPGAVGRIFYLTPHLRSQRQPGYAAECITHSGMTVWQVALEADAPPNVYEQVPDARSLAQLRASLTALWTDAQIGAAVCVVQHPFWLELARGYGDALLVYDCMDHHAGFDNTAVAHLAREEALLEQSDLTVVTSGALADWARPSARALALVRNAADFSHFHAARGQTQPLAGRRPIVGYYGAIASWFDLSLVETLVQQLGDCDWLLIGDDTVGALERLRRHPQVQMPGEVRYAELPQWLARFDVCLIPFQRVPLTLATNPVKVYEYLSAGKPVVATELPELEPLAEAGLVRLARDADGFAQAIRAALAELQGPQAETWAEQRIAYARGQTWAARAQALLTAVAGAQAAEPLVSVVVVCYNQWALTERCLQSLEASADGAAMQIIAVDNASSDETAEQLRAWQAERPGARIAQINHENLGFAGGVNSGMAHAQGDFLVVLNNDTIVTPGWARAMRRHLERDASLGLVCPVTNHIGNEARVDLPGETPEAVLSAAKAYIRVHAGQLLPLTTAAFFCVMMRRSVWAQIGPMDEQFFPGYFEDDDYCRRLQAAGYHIGCAEDAFVYHELSASFDREGTARKREIFERNRQRYEAKWGPWAPHRYRAAQGAQEPQP